ncbi:MAG: beta-galactosidase family protein [Oscillospiraceae bacterium]|nr:beta-galactosidase family protein [Oscillospiraceae bacterium]
MKKDLCIKNGSFYLDDDPFIIRSGSIHYFRVFPEYWKERLLQLKSCGMNTVETYSCWNLHEPQKGCFDFSGMLDLKKFIEAASEVGLYVILRPGPYICAEWDFGGFPAWLLKDENIRLRCNSEPYMTHVRDYLNKYCDLIHDSLYSRGGNVIALQIENEYGSFGNDKSYLAALKELYLKNGIDTFFFTSDGPVRLSFQGGSLPEVYETANFGSNAKAAFDELKRFRPDDPPMCTEFWDGWFDHWAIDAPHHTRDTESFGKEVADMLDANASFNFYMFHGGTNFGFMNGANYDGKYMPTVTSYDYDSIISEWGGYTEKYTKLCSLMKERTKVKLPERPAEHKRRAYGEIILDRAKPFLSCFKDISGFHHSSFPDSMEKYDQNTGYIVYEKRLCGPHTGGELSFGDIRDRAYIFADGKLLKTIYRNDEEQNKHLKLPEIPESGLLITIVTENMGRVNYGSGIYDRKGIIGGIKLDYQYQFEWDVYTCPMTDIPDDGYIPSSELSADMLPAFMKGTLFLNDAPDGHTFIKTEGFKKGIVFVNGFNLGRYFDVGPTKTLFLPEALLKKGENDIVVFEQEGIGNAKRSSQGYPICESVDTPRL